MSINREKTKPVLFILAEMQNERAVKNQIQKWYSEFQHLNVTCHSGKWIQNSGQINIFPVHRRGSELSLAGTDICRHAQSRDPSPGKRRCWKEGSVYNQQHIRSIEVWRNRISAEHPSLNPTQYLRHALKWGHHAAKEHNSWAWKNHSQREYNAGAYSIQEGMSKPGVPYSKQHNSHWLA